MKKSIILLAVFTIICGCTSTRISKKLSSGVIGCQPDEISIFNETASIDGFHNWEAICNDKNYVCRYHYSAGVNCKRVSSSKDNKFSGFRGINWKTNISSLQDMKYVRTDPSSGGMKVYSRNNDDLRIGGAELTSIEYFFWQDNFSSVVINFSNVNNYDSVKSSMVERFGDGYKGNRFIEEYIWSKPDAHMLKYSEVTNNGMLYITSSEIQKKMAAYDEEKAKEGAVSGF